MSASRPPALRDRSPQARQAQRATQARKRRAVWSAVGALLLVAAVVVAVAVVGGDESAPERVASVSSTNAPAVRAAAALTPTQLAGQAVIAPFRNSGAQIPTDLRRAITAGQVGGVILFSENATTLAQARALTKRLQAIPRPKALRSVPLLVLSDQEGGQVRRLRDAPPRASARDQGAAGVAATRRTGRDTARALCRAGITVNLAPVADVGAHSFVNAQQRTFSNVPRRVGTIASAFVDGAQKGGIGSTAKHFPGLGRARINTDDRPSRVTATRSQLRDRDEQPFRALVRSEVELIMLSNAIYPAFGPAPAVLTRAVVTGELRKRLGYTGVTISDDLQAGAFAAARSPAAVAVTAARAGVDLLLYGGHTAGALAASRALTQAQQQGALSRTALRQAAERTLALRMRLARTCRAAT